MIWALVIGLVIGALAKFFMPGKDPGGIIVTIVIGILGAALANWIGVQLGIYAEGGQAGIIASVLGAMLVLFIYRVIAGKRNA